MPKVVCFIEHQFVAGEDGALGVEDGPLLLLIFFIIVDRSLIEQLQRICSECFDN
jgi:hypothetical protein